MINSSKVSLILASLCLLASCKSATPPRVPSATMSNDLKKLYVLVAPGTDNKWSADSFKTEFSAEAQSCGVGTVFYVEHREELSLDNEQARDKSAIEAGVADYKPDYILEVLEMSTLNSLRQFALVLSNTATKTVVWRTGSDVSAGDTIFTALGATDGGTRVAADTIKKMKQAGILRSCPTSNK